MTARHAHASRMSSKRDPEWTCVHLNVERRTGNGFDEFWGRDPRHQALLCRRVDHDLPRRLPPDCPSVGAGRSLADRSPIRHRGLSAGNDWIQSNELFQTSLARACALHPIQSRDVGFGTPSSMGAADASRAGSVGGSMGGELLRGFGSFFGLAGMGQTGSQGSGFCGLRTSLDKPRKSGASFPVALVGHAAGRHEAQGGSRPPYPEAGAAHAVVHFKVPSGAVDPRSVHGLRLDSAGCPTPRYSRCRNRPGGVVLRSRRLASPRGSSRCPGWHW